MSKAPGWNAALDPQFYDGRVLIDILAWDWNLRVGVSGPTTRPKARFQAGLDYRRDFLVEGRIRAPGILRGNVSKISLSPFGPKLLFGRNGLKEVGSLNVAPAGGDAAFEVILMLPESAIATTATSLASAWKHLHLQTFDEAERGARISAFSFSAAIHANLLDWANDD